MYSELILANKLLDGFNVSVLDAARLIRNILDSIEKESESFNDVKYCRNIIELGIKTYQTQNKDKTLIKGFEGYILSKSNLEKDSFKDIRYLGNRLFRIRPDMRYIRFSSINSARCLDWLESVFSTPSQFNKGRTFLSGFFSFAIKNKWIRENPILDIEPKFIEENEIKPLSMDEIKNLLYASLKPMNSDCRGALGIMLWAGVRPKELSRLRWKDVDLDEKIITIRSFNSKTGGTRHIEICSVLKKWLLQIPNREHSKHICPKDWLRRWKLLRDSAGFKGMWVNDVLRHTFASYHLKHFKNLIRLQTEMGHRDLILLRSRYVNMHGITKDDARLFFNLHRENLF